MAVGVGVGAGMGRKKGEARRARRSAFTHVMKIAPDHSGVLLDEPHIRKMNE